MIIIVLPTTIIDDNEKVFPPFQVNDNDVVTEDRYRQVSELDFSITHTPTESSAGGTLLYISKRLSHQLRNDLTLSMTQEKFNQLL